MAATLEVRELRMGVREIEMDHNNFQPNFSREKNMRRLTLITLSVLLLATVARAQALEQSWDNLKTLREGEKIQVVDQKLKSQNGTFVSFSDEAITFQADKDQITIQRAEVFRVSSRKGASRGEHALVGLAIGAGTGFMLGMAGCANATDQNECSGSDKAALGAVVALFLGGIGAGVGALVPSDYPTIYRAERRKDTTAP
ncbi:MAG: hypothetical protein HYS38_00465 [Acidobacteria bacterium]|nr:hypothetical protein [Acidobacteriota bacterium]